MDPAGLTRTIVGFPDPLIPAHCIKEFPVDIVVPSVSKLMSGGRG